ncbi:MAG: fibronectin type III domain-containing protein [bacterium]|nr:fibronectin type III domain-containing protein [bacterium]
MGNRIVLSGCAIAVLTFAGVKAEELQVVATTPNSVTLTWIAPGDDNFTGQASAYDIRYSLTTITAANWASATRATGVPAPKVAGSAESFDVTGLASSTTYFFAMKAGDEIPNWSAMSNVVQKTTLQEATPPSAIVNLTAGTVTSSSIALAWTAPGDDGTVGTATLYDIRYSTSTITASNWANAAQVAGETAPRVAGSAESFVVAGLNPATTYYFAIKTADEAANLSALSNVATKATGAESTPPSAIANLAAPTSGETTVTLTWTAPGDDGNSGTATQYDIRYSTTAITAANFGSATQVASEPSPKVAGSAETFTVTGLALSSTYYFAIKTADEAANWSGLSNVISKATTGDTTPPAQVTDLAAY